MFLWERHILKDMIQKKKSDERQQSIRQSVKECLTNSHPQFKTLPNKSHQNNTSKKIPKMNREDTEKTGCHHTEKKVWHWPYIKYFPTTIKLRIPILFHLFTLSFRHKQSKRYLSSVLPNGAQPRSSAYLLFVKQFALFVITSDSLIALLNQGIVIWDMPLEFCD